MVDSTALVGSARVGQARVGSLGAGAPPYLRAGGGCWRLVSDPAIGDIADTLEGWTSEGGLIDQLRSDVDGQVDWWYQTTEPADAKSGDYWIPGDGPMQVLTATGWEDISDPRIEKALEAAGTAQATADGKITTYGGQAAPAGTTGKPLGEGDLWVRDGDARLHVYRSGAWVLVDKVAIDAAEKAAKDYTDEQKDSWLDTAATAAQEKAKAAQDEAVRLAGVAAEEADEALQEALGELVADKSNVFIQVDEPVESMRRAGVLWIDTNNVYLPGADGPVQGNVPKTWSGTAWVAITDSAVVQAAAEAADARAAAEAAADAAGEAMAEARYAPRIAQRPPVQADGVDKPVGAGWLEYATTTNYQDVTADRLVQQWMWTGTTWVRLDMDPAILPVVQIGTGTFGDLTGDRVTVTGTLAAALAEIIELSVEHLTVVEGATISEAVAIAISGATLNYQEAYLHNLRVDGLAEIDEAVIGALAANMITSGLFRTAEFGQRLEIDSTGLVMYGVDVDGVEYEMVRLGPSGENLLTIGGTTVAPDGVRSPAGTFDALSVGGDDLTTILERLPRGVRAWGELRDDSQYDSNPTIYSRRGEIQTTVEPNRLYKASLSSHYVSTNSPSATTALEELRFSFDATPVNIQISPDAGTIIGAQHRQHVWNGSGRMVPGMEFYFNTGNDGQRIFWLMWLIRPENDTAAVRVLGRNVARPVLALEDMGPAQPEILKRWNDGNGGGTQDTAPTIVRTVDRIWDAASYGGDVKDGKVYQGTLSPYGNRYGGWVLPPSMRSALAGSTIEKLEVKLKNAHWWDKNGGTARVVPNTGGYKDIVGVGTESSRWPRGAERWVPLPSAWYPHFASELYRGVSVYTTSTNLLYYGQFYGAATQFKATFRK